MTHVEPRPCDWRDYPTVRFPERYEADWKTFYRDGYESTRAFAKLVKSAQSVTYGTHPYQILDVFAKDGVDQAPVLIYFHGGGFKEGHPSHYGALGREFVEKSAVFVSVGYRLLPETPFPGCVEDGALALKWIADNIAEYGGDPHNLYLSGHSAGSEIIAVLSLTDTWDNVHGLPPDAIVGTIHLSGVFDWDITDPAYPDMDARDPKTSIVKNIRRTPSRIMVSYGVPEAQRVGQSLDYFQRQGDAFVSALRAFGSHPEVVPLDDTHHLGTALALGDPKSPVHSVVTRMMRL